MPRGRPVTPVVLNDDEKSQLLSLANSPHGLVQRAQIVLACAQGDANFASRMHLNNSTVGKWRLSNSALRACR